MSDKIIIVDFEDSFTYNIANILFAYEKKCRVLSHQEFFESFFEKIIIGGDKVAVILGPGPGHPDNFQIYFEKIKKLIQNRKIYCMGICLGHQIMARVQGFDVSLSLNQIHGQSVEILFQGSTKIVQRYNSLSVYVNGRERNIIEYPNGISYQFHPESIGTDQNIIYFEDLLSYIK